MSGTKRGAECHTVLYSLIAARIMLFSQPKRSVSSMVRFWKNGIGHVGKEGRLATTQVVAPIGVENLAVVCKLVHQVLCHALCQSHMPIVDEALRRVSRV